MNMRVLLAEDSATNRLVASKILEVQGFAVDIATNGHEALSAARAFVYDLVLMDVSMPGMDGISATREIRKLPDQNGRVPILAMTAHAMPGDRERCLAAGMDDYIAKPITHEKLLQVIGRWVAVQPRPVVQTPAVHGQGTGPLDQAVLDALASDVNSRLLPELVHSGMVEIRTRTRSIVTATEAGDLAALLDQTRGLGDLARTFGARHLQHWARACEHVCGTGNAAMARGLAGSLVQLADEAIEALGARFPV